MKFLTISAALAATAVAENVVNSYVLKEGELAFKAQNDKGETSIVIVSAAETNQVEGENVKRWSWLDWRMFEPIC
ncbi:hypothetical protein DICA2_D10352 [Diutina catenulata]